MNPIRPIPILLLSVALLLTGCATPPAFREPLRQVDQFFQDLGNSINRTTRKITGEQPTRRQINYQPQNGFVFKIQKATLTPTKVKKGEQVKLTLRYVIMGAPADGLKVTEKSRLLRDGKVLTVLKDDASSKENGTWENTFTFAVPDSASPGKYTLVQELSAQGQTRSSQRSFTVW